MAKTVSLHTLGCKLNYSETSTIGALFHKNGFTLKDYGEHSDIFVLNTCTVTDKADKECRQIIRSVLHKNPDTYVIVTGCYAQLKPQEISSIQGVDLVLGTNEKFKLFDYIDNYNFSIGEKKNYSCTFTSPVSEITDFDYAYSSDLDSRTRAFLKIQDGCDYNCSFCTIPLARGASRSLSIYKVIENAKKLVDSGYKEIVLTGVNTGDYNYFSNSNGTTGKKFKLIDVLYELDKLNISRIRISSIEPNLLTDEIIQLVKSSPKFCKHFHIPLQCGDKDILKLMRRRYNRDFFKELISRLNSEIPGIGIGVDVIVGFPGETDSKFENTCEFINSMQISYLHVFSYSERNDTSAAEMPGQVDIEKRKERNRILRELSLTKKRYFYLSHIGTFQNVLFESLKDNGNIFGFTDNYIKIKLRGNSKMENKISQVRIISTDSANYCNAELV